MDDTLTVKDVPVYNDGIITGAYLKSTSDANSQKIILDLIKTNQDKMIERSRSGYYNYVITTRDPNIMALCQDQYTERYTRTITVNDITIRFEFGKMTGEHVIEFYWD